jgi:hypothetical protein
MTERECKEKRKRETDSYFSKKYLQEEKLKEKME